MELNCQDIQEQILSLKKFSCNNCSVSNAVLQMYFLITSSLCSLYFTFSSGGSKSLLLPCITEAEMC